MKKRKMLTREIKRMLKTANEDVIDLIYLMLLKSTQASLDSFDLFGTVRQKTDYHI